MEAQDHLLVLLSSATAAAADDDDDTIEFGLTDDIKAVSLAIVGFSLTQAAPKVRRPGYLLMCVERAGSSRRMARLSSWQLAEEAQRMLRESSGGPGIPYYVSSEQEAAGRSLPRFEPHQALCCRLMLLLLSATQLISRCLAKVSTVRRDVPKPQGCCGYIRKLVLFCLYSRSFGPLNAGRGIYDDFHDTLPFQWGVLISKIISLWCYIFGVRSSLVGLRCLLQLLIQSALDYEGTEVFVITRT